MGDGTRRTRSQACALGLGLVVLTLPAPSRVAWAAPASPRAPEPATSNAPPPTGYYQLVARHSGQCLDIAGASTEPNVPAVQWYCHGGEDQQWRLEALPGGGYRLTARHSGNALEVLDGSLEDAAPVVQNTPSDVPQQQWIVTSLGDGYYSLIARHSGKALDVFGESTQPGTAVIQYTPHLHANQQWFLREIVEAPQVTSADVIRFLEQATWGPTPELVAHVQSVGFEHFLNEQFDAPTSSYPTMPLYPTTRDNVACPSGSACQRDNYTIYPLQKRFFTNALYGAGSTASARRLRAAPDHRRLRTSTSPSQAGWRRTSRCSIATRSATTASCSTTCRSTRRWATTSTSPATPRPFPNENYGREILQLFSLGYVPTEPGRYAAARSERRADSGLYAGRPSTISRGCSPGGSGRRRRRPACRTTSIRWSRTSPSTTSARRRC